MNVIVEIIGVKIRIT